MKDKVIILIPVYNPTDTLVELVNNLKKEGYTKIIVVNDGSKDENVFEIIEKEVTLLKHDENKGKGRALKTGFGYCLSKFKDILGIITVDADGQHLIKDINKVYKKLVENPNSLILGSREFRKENTPFKSLIGNKIIRYIFKQKTKVKIKDTQTGLRAIPYTYLKDFIKVEGERFDYEMNTLIYSSRKKFKIIEEDIDTVYIEKNKNSNFQKIKDSIRILKVVFIKNKNYYHKNK